MKLSICIPTYNRPELLDNCLNSIYISKKINQNLNLKFVFQIIALIQLVKIYQKNTHQNLTLITKKIRII